MPRRPLNVLVRFPAVRLGNPTSHQLLTMSTWQTQRFKLSSILPLRRPRVDLPEVQKTDPHRALRIPDIVFSIFEEFDPLNREDVRACANAARVCRLLYEPASRVVWRRLSSLAPLWYILLENSEDATPTRSDTSPDVVPYVTSVSISTSCLPFLWAARRQDLSRSCPRNPTRIPRNCNNSCYAQSGFGYLLSTNGSQNRIPFFTPSSTIMGAHFSYPCASCV